MLPQIVFLKKAIEEAVNSEKFVFTVGAKMCQRFDVTSLRQTYTFDSQLQEINFSMKIFRRLSSSRSRINFFKNSKLCMIYTKYLFKLSKLDENG